jgi:CBS domain containing-hemolysin-like protein
MSGPDAGKAGAGPEGGRAQRQPFEALLERLRAAVGLKSGSMREDLADALATEDVAGGFSPGERAMIANILRLREERVHDVMVPRADIEAVEIGITLGELLARFQASGHSRMPVFRDSLDDPVGLVHIKDLMGHFAAAAALPAEGGVGEGVGEGRARPPAGFDLYRVDLTRPLSDTALVRAILFVPPSMPVAALLHNMQASRMQMALVIDEYGGTDGLVSIEDAVEMIVGDIDDEYDDDTGPMIVPDGKGGFLADARADLDEVTAALGVSLTGGETREDVDTLGGFLFNLVGRIPVRGELIATGGDWEFEILDADPRRIKRVRVARRPPPEPKRRPRPLPEGGGPPPAPSA